MAVNWNQAHIMYKRLNVIQCHNIVTSKIFKWSRNVQTSLTVRYHSLFYNVLVATPNLLKHSSFIYLFIFDQTDKSIKTKQNQKKKDFIVKYKDKFVFSRSDKYEHCLTPLTVTLKHKTFLSALFWTLKHHIFLIV